MRSQGTIKSEFPLTNEELLDKIKYQNDIPNYDAYYVTQSCDTNGTYYYEIYRHGQHSKILKTI